MYMTKLVIPSTADLWFLVNSELGESLSEFGKAVKLLGTCEDDALGKAFSELGAKSQIISIKLQKEVFSTKNNQWSLLLFRIR